LSSGWSESVQLADHVAVLAARLDRGAELVLLAVHRAEPAEAGQADDQDYGSQRTEQEHELRAQSQLELLHGLSLSLELNGSLCDQGSFLGPLIGLPRSS
jgi:hypothetical protein